MEIPLRDMPVEEAVPLGIDLNEDGHSPRLAPVSDAVSTMVSWRQRLRAYVDMLYDVAGWRFLGFLVFSQFIGKGFMASLIGGTVLPLFRDRVGPATLQIYMMIMMIPWGAKPLIGLCSDYMVLCGYHKRGWLVIGAVLAIAAGAMLFVVSSPALLVVCFMAMQFQIALYDLLSEAKYSELRNEHPCVGNSFTSLCHGLHHSGGLAVIAFVGILAQLRYFSVLFALALGTATALFIPTILGWMPEERVAGAPRIAGLVHTERLRRERGLIGLVAFCGMGGIVGSIVVTAASPITGLAVSVLFLIATLVCAWRVFPPAIAHIAAYQVLTTLSQPSLGAAMDYFYTAPDTCLADGPHFSYVYYIMYAGIVGRVISILGSAVYEKTLSKFRVRSVLLLTTVGVSLAGLSDLFIVLRWNVRIGLSDQWAYMIGEAVLEPLWSTLNWIPMSGLIAMSAPRGAEASCFAFMAGLSNFAGMVSELSGAIIFKAAGITADPADGCNFDNLWWLILMCHILFRVIVGCTAAFLVPNVRQDVERLE